ncbi:MAG: LmbE family protein, partial [Bryobacteraceae bacterium]
GGGRGAGGGGRGGGGRGGGRGGAAPAGPAEPQVEVDLGAYSPELGYSYGEIAGMSRSQHRSQGMGSAERKGSQMNTLTTEVGDKATKDIFEGIDITWNRVPGGAPVGTVLKQALDSFVPAHPEELLPLLAKARPLIAAIKDPLAEQKLKELDEAMALCAALSLEAQADKFEVSPGANLRVTAMAIVRSPAPVTLTGISLTGMQGAPAASVVAPAVLVNNQPSQYPLTVAVPGDQPYTQPYWLVQPKDGTLYAVSDQRLIGNPENAPALEAHFRVRIAGTDLELIRPVQNRYVDRVYGERIRPLAIVPPVAIDLAENALVFPDTKARKIDVPVKSNGGKVSGDVRLEVPAGWNVEPTSRHFDLTFTDEQLSVSFELTPPQAATRGEVRAVAQVGSHAVSTGTETIQYSHIPTQTLFPPAETPLVRTDVKVLAKNVGYIMGAGDDVPQAIQQLGCEVTLLTAGDLAHGDLSKFDAIVTGVRAFNTRADLRANYQRLLDYTSNGGTLVVQYNVAEGGAPGAAPAPAGGADAGPLEHIGPYPIRTSRDRVTVEEAPITFPSPQLRLLHAPNEITQADFEGWIQERGLYFADQFDERYKSVLESHDPGEMPLPGGMLYTPYGKGAYIFSAYDWFRELPAGVPGAYRMFANMLSAAKTQ